MAGDNIMRKIAPGACIIYAAFCIFLALPGSAEDEEEKEYRLFDRIGNLLLVYKDKDVYIQDVEGKELVRSTTTRDVFERDAFFSRDGRHIMYEVDKSRRYPNGDIDVEIHHYMQEIDKNDKHKQKIEEVLYRDFKKERLKDKHGSIRFLDILRGRSGESAEEGLLESLKSKEVDADEDPLLDR
ncbi:hypothetical protein ACFL42_04745 [Candidatus Omnitrophota bacterium]